MKKRGIEFDKIWVSIVASSTLSSVVVKKGFFSSLDIQRSSCVHGVVERSDLMDLEPVLKAHH